MPEADGVIGFVPIFADRKGRKVLHFGLMIKRGLNETATRIRKVKRSMKYYAGLDVSVKETSVCIVVGRGRQGQRRRARLHNATCRIASKKMLPSGFVASPKMLPVKAYAAMMHSP